MYYSMNDRMANTTVVERSDHWVLPLGGEVVIQCCYDYAFTIQTFRNNIDKNYGAP